jgi:LmbE family N-acetylglucosaminyl deacetylase
MLQRPETFMVVAAHPDDIEMSCGGTVAKWIAAGSHGYFLLVTNGENGGRRCDLTSAELAANREKEQLAAAKVLGVEGVEFLHHADGLVTYTSEFRGEIVRWIRKWKPDALLTHDPTVLILDWNEINHKDHRTVGEAAMDAVYPFARGRLLYADQLKNEGLTPHAVKDLLLWDSANANHYEDVEAFMEKRIEAVACHTTQFPKIDPVGKWLHAYAEKIGTQAKLARAEAFRHVDLRPVF